MPKRSPGIPAAITSRTTCPPRRQGAAVGVAQHDPARPRLQRRLQARQRIIGVGAVAVKEMLGIKQRLAPLGGDMGKRGRNRLAVFLQRHAKRGGDVEFMGLADQTDRGRARIQHRRQHIVRLSADRPTRLVMPNAVIVARVCGA